VKFLEAIREAGLPVPTRAHYALPETGIPVAEIDFKVGRVHVLVDGSVHAGRWVAETDDKKRTQLKFLGYTVMVVRVSHLDEDI
jgi:hypothetical protein